MPRKIKVRVGVEKTKITGEGNEKFENILSKSVFIIEIVKEVAYDKCNPHVL